MEGFDGALLILRLWLGSVMLAAGVDHARNIDGPQVETASAPASLLRS